MADDNRDDEAEAKLRAYGAKVTAQIIEHQKSCTDPECQQCPGRGDRVPRPRPRAPEPDNWFMDMAAFGKRMEAESREHKLSCVAPECHRCERFVCRKCSVSIPREGTCEPCAREYRRGRWARHALHVVPKGFAESSLDAHWLVALVGPKVIAEARESLAAERVAFIGPPGSGKTSLAVAMFIAAGDALPDHGSPTHTYVSAHQLAKARAFHPLGQGDAPLVESAMAASVLVLDELGGEDPRYASAVAEVLYERHAADRPTWVTTGVGPAEIATRYGGGIARRVFEDAKVFQLPGRKR